MAKKSSKEQSFGANFKILDDFLDFSLEIVILSFFKKGDFWDLTKGDPASSVMHLTKPHHPFPWDRPFFTFLVQGRCVVSSFISYLFLFHHEVSLCVLVSSCISFYWPLILSWLDKMKNCEELGFAWYCLIGFGWFIIFKLMISI